MITKTRFAITFSLFLFLVTAHTSAAYSSSWELFKDEDGIFTLSIPENYKINKKSIRTDDSNIVTSAEITAKVDQRPLKNVIKQYIVKYDQTLNDYIADNDIPQLIQNEIRKYKDFYGSVGGKILDSNVGEFNGYPGVEFIIYYPDQNKEPQHMRTHVLYTNSTRFEQIIIGRQKDLFSSQTKNYFQSLAIKDGKTYFPGKFSDEWVEKTSPFELFKIRTPYPTEPFLDAEPKVSTNEKLEKISSVYTDPVYNYRLFYNIYGYRFTTPLTAENVQRVIMEKHLGKFKVNYREMRLAKTKAGGFPAMSTEMNFPAPRKAPYANTIRVNAFYYGNFLVIQEMIGNHIHVNSKFSQSLLRNFKFTPIEGNLKYQKEKHARKLNQQEKE